jgi:hypothetical protein
LLTSLDDADMFVVKDDDVLDCLPRRSQLNNVPVLAMKAPLYLYVPAARWINREGPNYWRDFAQG